jgi:hypothetical protein
MFMDMMKGEGIAAQSAEKMATTFARRLEGRSIHIAGEIDIHATVDAVDEVRPPAPLAAIPTGVPEVPMWTRVRGRLREVSVGGWHVDSVSVVASDLVLVGTAADRLRVGEVGFVATIAAPEVVRWAEAIDGDHCVRVADGRIEVSDRRVARWIWLEVAVTVENRVISIEPVQLRALGRPIPMPRRFRRIVTRPATWIPGNVTVESAAVVSERVEVVGAVGETLVPVDVTKVLTDLGAEGTMSVLRIVTGDW